MKGYFYVIILTSVCGSLCTLLADGGYEKYIKYIVALICAVIILSPFRELDLKEIENALSDTHINENISDGLYPLATDLTEEKTKEYISSIVFSKFGINPISINIKIDWSREEPIIQEIKVYLDSDSMKHSREISEYLSMALGGEVYVDEA